MSKPDSSSLYAHRTHCTVQYVDAVSCCKFANVDQMPRMQWHVCLWLQPVLLYLWT